jgi:hypothetical protein
MAQAFPPALIMVLAIESGVLHNEWKSIGPFRSFLLVCFVNAISWIAGILITGYFFPSGYSGVGPGNFHPDKNFSLYAGLGFIIAFFLSVLIEGSLLISWARKYGEARPFRVALIGNTASYAVLAVFSLWYFHG